MGVLPLPLLQISFIHPEISLQIFIRDFVAVIFFEVGENL